MAGKTIRVKLVLCASWLLCASGLLVFAPGLVAAQSAMSKEPATGLISSKAVMANSRTGKVYGVDPVHDAVVIFDSGGVTDTRVPVGAAPVAIAINEATNRIYVANAGADTVSVMDGESNAVVATVKVGTRPYAIAANPSANKIYVSIAFGDAITEIDGKTNATTAAKIMNADSITVDAKLGKVYLAGYEDTNLVMIDSSPRAAGPEAVAPEMAGKLAIGIHLWGIAVNESTHTIYATRSGSAELAALDEISGAMKTVPVGVIPCSVAVNPVTNMVYVVNHGDDTVTAVDGAKNAVVATVGVGKRPQGIAVDTARNLVYVANKLGDSVAVIDGAANRVIKTLKTGKNPYAVAVSPRTGKIYVALEGPEAIQAIDPVKAP